MEVSIPLLVITGGWAALIGFLWWLFRRNRRPVCGECRAQMHRVVIDHGDEGEETVWSCPRGHTEILPPDDMN